MEGVLNLCYKGLFTQLSFSAITLSFIYKFGLAGLFLGLKSGMNEAKLLSGKMSTKRRFLRET